MTVEMRSIHVCLGHMKASSTRAVP